ncbi:MAG: MMPL family transporter [Clostridiales bacterium]|nr:MMPL family transporter [Clostridiales bacterium]
MRKIAEFIVNKRILFMILFAVAVVYCALCISRVDVEYDISTYLPENTDTKKALDVMAKEFESFGTATLLVKGLPSIDAANELHDDIMKEAGDGITMFSFTANDYKDGNAKFSITFSGKSSDKKAQSAYDKTVKIIKESGYKYTVPKPLVNNYAETLASEVVIILAISAAIIIAVLLFTSKSFAEVIAFPIVFIVAAVLNMGTNFWLGRISFVSNTVCIVLQLALAIDYAIILCHRFTEEKENSPGDAKTALIAALAKAIPEIASSSLTTISGLVALMFMQLGLGFDLGMVLAKSIVCSLLTVFLLMPGILLFLSKAMDKTRHRNFVPRLRFWGKGVVKARYVLIPVFVALFAVGAALSQKIEYVYSTEDIDTSRPTATVVAKRECEKIFGYENTFAILVKSGDPESERRIVETVKEMGGYPDLVSSAMWYWGLEYNGVRLTDSVTAAEFAEIIDADGQLPGIEKITAQLFELYAGSIGADYSDEFAAPVIDILDYLIENKAGIVRLLQLAGKPEIVPVFTEKLAGAEQLLGFAKSQLVGKNHSRLVFNLNAGIEDERVFKLIKELTPAVKKIRADATFAGSSMSAYDLNQSFSSDNILITLLTIIFIYIILAFTFRSWGIPIVLVLAIQGAIFMNFSLPFITGGNLFFFTYLIISAIQMGATIDYAILVTNRFNHLKTLHDRREAMTEAVSGAFPTVFTSGTIMCVAGFLVGSLTSDPLISSIGMYIGTGTIISIACVLLVLPAMLYTLDPLLKRTVFKPRHPMKKVHLPNPSLPIGGAWRIK